MSDPKAPHLAKLQADFQAYLYNDVKGAAFKARIVNDKKVGAKKRLSIYYDAYRLRIIGVLASDYPNLKKYLGDNFFERTARSYIDKFPSTFCNMRWVGKQMALHLQKTLPQHPVAAELAQFEWALGLAFDAEDIPALQLQDLAAIPPEDWGSVMLKAQPSAHILIFKYNTVSIWKALNTDEKPAKAQKTNDNYLVWRKGLESYYRSIEVLEQLALEKMLTGITFGALCEFLQGGEVVEGFTEEAAMQTAAQYLASWLEAELICVPKLAN